MVLRSGGASLVLVLLLVCGCAPRIGNGLSNQEFVETVYSLSERPGGFDTDNLISNETGYLRVIPKLHQLGVKGGAYIGVGPDQNFTYIAQVRPEIAIILDIRRDNLLQHLMFKALFARARSRAEFLALLLSRPVPAGNLPLAQLVAELAKTPGQEALYQANLKDLLERVKGFGLNLQVRDLPTITRFYHTFFEKGLDLRFEFNSKTHDPLHYPSFQDFLLAPGRGSFLDSDDDFAFVKNLEERNLVVPVVGNFAGPTALASVAAYLRRRALSVSVFYASNVEYYLVPDQELDDPMEAFVDNLSLLPVDDHSMLIRTYLNDKEAVTETSPRPHPRRQGDELFTTTMVPLKAFIERYQAGKYQTYWDIVTDDLDLEAK